MIVQVRHGKGIQIVKRKQVGRYRVALEKTSTDQSKQQLEKKEVEQKILLDRIIDKIERQESRDNSNTFIKLQTVPRVEDLIRSRNARFKPRHKSIDERYVQRTKPDLSNENLNLR